MLVGSLLTSCEQQVNLLGEEDHLVVEGWITTGGHPIVLLHRSYNLNNPNHANVDADVDVEELFQKQFIAWGKVSISDGDTTIILNARINRDYLPSTTYSTVWMDGVPGKTYTIQVDYRDYHATATSTMLEPWNMDSLRVFHHPQAQNASIMAYFSGFREVADTIYLVLQYRQLGDSRYRMKSLCARHSYMAIDDVLSFPVNLSYDSTIVVPSDILDSLPVDTLAKSIYDIRVARVGKREYEYLNMLLSRMTTGGTYFLSMYGNMPSVVNGGHGYWAAMGTQNYRISTETDTTYTYRH